jgi:hypothetical protein
VDVLFPSFIFTLQRQDDGGNRRERESMWRSYPAPHKLWRGGGFFINPNTKKSENMFWVKRILRFFGTKNSANEPLITDESGSSEVIHACRTWGDKSSATSPFSFAEVK